MFNKRLKNIKIEKDKFMKRLENIQKEKRYVLKKTGKHKVR
jgi:hypothetical protein